MILKLINFFLKLKAYNIKEILNFKIDKKIIMSALSKALLATLFFMIFHLFYSSEIIRSNVEDIAFDTVNKFSIHTKPQEVKSADIKLFAIDDLYKKTHSLFDEDNRSNYGYTFPRDLIAEFIENLDELVSDLDEGASPKALFIDYDMSFSTMPYGKELSKEDKKLIEVLAKPRDYRILLAKTEQANFIESSENKELQKRIEEGYLKFVSVPLLSSNRVVRRYKSSQQFGEKNPSKNYESVNVVLWKTLRDSNETTHFQDHDIVGNRIFLKEYDEGVVDNEGCLVQESKWKELKKYSANCSLFEIPYEEYNGSVILLGGTDSQNSDKFATLSVLGSNDYAGIDIHANALLTMLFLDTSLKQLSLLWGMIIVFVSFFTLDIIVTLIFNRFDFKHEKISFGLLLVLNTLLFYFLALYFLENHHLWFNWFVPMVIFQILKLILIINKKTPRIKVKIRKMIRKKFQKN